MTDTQLSGVPMEHVKAVLLIADGVPDSQGDAFFGRIHLPEWASVRADFDIRRPIGRAEFSMEFDEGGSVIGVHMELVEDWKRHFPAQVPLYACFGGNILSKRLEVGKTVIEECELTSVGICTSNSDPRVPAIPNHLPN